MRELVLAVLALASALVPNIASASSEWVNVVGGKLSSSGPPLYFSPRRVNILITKLPAHWPARAGQCQTLKHEGVPKIAFDFDDGLTTGDRLVASGYTLDGDKAGKSFLTGRTFIKLCRNAAGKPAAFAVQLSYYKFTNNVIQGYVVYAENNGARGGKSSDYEGAIFSRSATSGGTASSNAVNTLQVGP